MKKTLLYAATASMLFAASCKETLDPIIIDEPIQDTFLTYNEPVENPQLRRIYVEELTGVQCTNCPAAAEELHNLSTTTFPGELSIVAFHTALSGRFCESIFGASKQNFITEDGKRIFKEVWGVNETKPSAIFDRIPLSITAGSLGNKLYNGGSGGWNTAIVTDKDQYKTTPVNVYISSIFDVANNRYDIVVKVKYTKTVAEDNALHIFLSQDNIFDAQLLEGTGTNIDTNHVFNHVFRKALTNPVTGKIILPDMRTKDAGLVYEYRTSITIDPNDPIQKNWDPKQMHLTAFVSIANNQDDIHVLQVQDTTLTN